MKKMNLLQRLFQSKKKKQPLIGRNSPTWNPNPSQFYLTDNTHTSISDHSQNDSSPSIFDGGDFGGGGASGSWDSSSDSSSIFDSGSSDSGSSSCD